MGAAPSVVGCSGRLLAARSARLGLARLGLPARSVGCWPLGRLLAGSGGSVGRSVGLLGRAARSAAGWLGLGWLLGRLARSAGSVGSAQPWPHRALHLVTAELTDRAVVCIPPGGTRIARILPTRQRTPARYLYRCGRTHTIRRTRVSTPRGPQPPPMRRLHQHHHRPTEPALLLRRVRRCLPPPRISTRSRLPLRP